MKAYPHEMSGGMRQRAMIALALACRPKLLLADEPTTALDATVQIQILLLLRELQREFGMGMIFVTHDIGVAVEVSDRIAVMYAGEFVETGTVREIIRSPKHPYTKGLLAANLHGAVKGQRLEAIPGAPPALETGRPPVPSRRVARSNSRAAIRRDHRWWISARGGWSGASMPCRPLRHWPKPHCRNRAGAPQSRPALLRCSHVARP